MWMIYLIFGASIGVFAQDGTNALKSLKNEVHKQIRSNREPSEKCYAELKAKAPDIKGKLVVTFRVNENAEVENINIVTSKTTILDLNFQTCIKNLMKEIKTFPKAPKGNYMDVDYPFHVK